MWSKTLFKISLLTYFLGALSSKAQSYEPMLGQLNEWHVTSCFGGCNTSAYFTDGDTIVEGLNYKILDGFHFISRTFLLREDLFEKKIYLALISPTKVSKFLLYDFSMEVGDSIELLNPVSPYPLLAGFYQLDSIVSKPLEDLQLYRHFYLSPTNSNTQSNALPVWIESVGSLSLINGPGSTPDFSGGGQLSCYFKDGESRYLNMDSIQACNQEHFLSLKELSDETQFRVYPNPSIYSFSVSSATNFSKGEILDMHGNLISNFKIKQDETHYHQLDPGVYFIRLLDGNSATREQKLIVIK